MLCPDRVPRRRPTRYSKQTMKDHNRRQDRCPQELYVDGRVCPACAVRHGGAHQGSMRDLPIAAVTPPQPRAYRGINWDGFRALYVREVRRFWKVGLQTLAAPIVTALLYMMVFVVAVGGSRPTVEGV